MNELPDTEATAVAEPVADPPVPEGPVDENGRSPAAAQWHKDMDFAQHLMYDLALTFNGDTFAVYQEKIVDRDKDFERLLDRVTKEYGIESWQVILIDPEDGIM